MQFHKSSERLAAEIAGFTSAGLASGEAVVIVASERHGKCILKALADLGVDSGRCQASGQLKLWNAEATLATIMGPTGPDRERFHAAFGDMIVEIKAAGYEHIRVYGEMAPMLWQRGNFTGALRLEGYANELVNLYGLPIFCGYMLDGFREDSYAGPLSDLGRIHTDIVPTSEDERLREAIDAATRKLLGTQVSKIVSLSEGPVGEARLPVGRRAILWLKRVMPLKVGEILELARRHAA
ncbi:MAG TPA: MEDS domain-containing protein [Candidatus Binatia bacterium]